MSSIISAILEKRGVRAEEQEHFLHPDFQRDVHNPLALKGMKKAVDRLVLAINKKESIGVFGDYDADGVPATALLVRAFAGLGVSIKPFIPTRTSGYGLTSEAVQQLKKEKLYLLITVDNGTVAQVEIASLVEAGIEVIVCDHHEPQAEHLATSALAIINPKQQDDTYPFKELCACALAWKLSWALYQALGKSTESLKWLLDLVAFSTIADMVPLQGENRVLATYGLTVLRKTRNLGMQALAQVAGVNLQEASAGSIGFRLAPRINAPSRMHQELQAGEYAALKLLTTQDPTEAQQLATYLNQQNSERQSLLEKHIQEAQQLAEGFKDQLCLVLYQEEWSTGVVGLVAGRLVERYKRPVVILAQEGSAIKGSVRSVEGVDAVAMLTAGEEFLERYGGHTRAAGLSLSLNTGEGVVGLRSLLNAWLGEQSWQLSSLRSAAERQADLDLPLEAVTIALAEEIKQLEPFGIGFAQPLFSTRCQLKALRRVGNEQQHLSCRLVHNNTERKAIGFSMGELDVEEGKEYEVCYSIALDEWNGQKTVSCQLQRIQ